MGSSLGGGAHLYFRLDFIKKTFKTYPKHVFSGMKNVVFACSFHNFPPSFFSNICDHHLKHTPFFNFAHFCTPK